MSPANNLNGNTAVMCVFTGKTILQYSGDGVTPVWVDYGTNALPVGIISISAANNTGLGLATNGTSVYYTTGNATPWIAGNMPSGDNLVGIWQNAFNNSFWAITTTTLYRSTNQATSWEVVKTL